MNGNILASILMALTVTAAVAQAPTKDALIARAKSFELDTPYVPPPGDPLTHHAAGFAKVMPQASARRSRYSSRRCQKHKTRDKIGVVGKQLGLQT